LPGGAAFCDGCGARIEVAIAPEPARARVGLAPAGHGMPVCLRCGSIAPAELAACATCSGPIGSSAGAVPKVPSDHWVRCVADVTCRSCGKRSPMEALDVDDTITCGTCHQIQAFDATVWEEALAHAHGVGDLAGSPLARNPYATIGVSKSSSTIELTGMTIERGVMKTRNVSLRAAPGHPLCAQCSSPLTVQARGHEAESRCPGCGDRMLHRFPARALQFAPGLVAAIGDELRIDRPTARLDATSAGMVVAVKCPSCGAALHVEEGKPSVQCTYCKTHCRIPHRTMLALKKSGAEAPFWLLFRGPSPKRRELEQPATASVRTDPGVPSSPPTLEALEEPPRPQTPAFRALAWGFQIAIPLAMLALVGVLLFGNVLLKWARGLRSTEGENVAPWAAPG
jgi:Zn finger protein HypA/HybF involved in hydrogenase expression